MRKTRVGLLHFLSAAALDRLPDTVRVRAAALQSLIARPGERFGMRTGDAAIVPELTTRADALSNVRLSRYFRRIPGAALKVRTGIRIVQAAPATLLIGANSGMGNLVVPSATEATTRRAHRRDNLDRPTLEHPCGTCVTVCRDTAGTRHDRAVPRR